jgi:hypothetical protein
MNVSIEEVAMILGQKEIEIFVLQKQIATLQKRIVELEKGDA